MARQLKPLEVGEGQFRDGSRFKVFYDRNRDEFFADVLGERVEGATEAACRSLARVRWTELCDVEWGRILVVYTADRFGHASDDASEVRFSHEVSEVGLVASSGRWMERDEGGRVHRYHGKAETDAEGGVYVLPWSPELEAACEEVARRLVDLRGRLRAILGDPDAVARLTAWAGKLLPPGDDG